MNIAQIYETTITDSDRNWLARFLVFPQQAFYEHEVPTDEPSLREIFGFTELQPLDTASALPRALAVLLAEDREEQFVTAGRRPPLPSLPPSSVIDTTLFNFAEELSFAEVVPFESSLLSLQSLASITLKAAKAGAVPLGAVTALVAVGQNPALLVAVPAGIVLCGGAIAVSKWFDQHRDEILSKVFRLKQRKTPVRRRIRFLPEEENP